MRPPFWRRSTGRWLYQIAERAHSAAFIEFLGQILDAHPNAPVIAIVLDNVSTHSSQAVVRWLAAHPRVHLLYGARYCPHHNPVERVWGAMKRHLANSPVLTMMDRLEEVHAFFRSRARAQILGTAAPFNTPWLPPGLRTEVVEDCFSWLRFAAFACAPLRHPERMTPPRQELPLR